MGAAIGTGMREGELWNNELADLHLDEAEPYIFVRYGSEGKPPKNGKTRRVPLFSVALALARPLADSAWKGAVRQTRQALTHLTSKS
jgi:integrase